MQCHVGEYTYCIYYAGFLHRFVNVECGNANIERRCNIPEYESYVEGHVVLSGLDRINVDSVAGNDRDDDAGNSENRNERYEDSMISCPKNTCFVLSAFL